MVRWADLALVDVDVLAPKEELVDPLELLPGLIPPPLQVHRRPTLGTPMTPVHHEEGVVPPRPLYHRPPGLHGPRLHPPLLLTKALAMGPVEGVDDVLELCLNSEPPVNGTGGGRGGRRGGQDRDKPLPNMHDEFRNNKKI